ncbi:MAG: ring-cleaving dioxygenase [Persicimonas sp.]
MTERIAGLHHVTAIAGDPNRNISFYTDVLGLRLVKRTVNFDDPSTYHLYFGDRVGHPGSILTFFPFQGARSGRVGRGQTSATAFTIPGGSLEFWIERLDAKGVDFEPPEERFGQTVLALTDHEGQPLELVVGAMDGNRGEPWTEGPVPADHAIDRFFGITIDSLDFEATKRVLETMGFERVGTEHNRTRFRGAEEVAGVVDVLDRPDALMGQQGVGTVHHVAFRTPDIDTQNAWRERLVESGLHVTRRKDRQYFRSIYFREPGGVLFEIATEGPGFTVDEPVDALGSELKLPPWLEEHRHRIEDNLSPLEVG